MKTILPGFQDIELLNFLEKNYENGFGEDVCRGLTARQKCIPCKYLYDKRGSQLFEEICRLPEYYPTRTELAILKEQAPEIMDSFQRSDLIELGSGSNRKIRILLDAAGRTNRATIRYIPVDISEAAVIDAASGLREEYPELHMLCIVADFTTQMNRIPRDRPHLILFLGSTIGNFSRDEQTEFLDNISSNMDESDRLLLGFDMIKPKEIIEAAYNDSRGITAKFNKNMLTVLNRELEANFDAADFEHIAFFNDEQSRIEMHLRAKDDIIVKIGSIDMELTLRRGETIHTENSRKFSREDIERIAYRARLKIQNWFTDTDEWFSLVEMVS